MLHDALMAEADAEHRDAAGECLDHRERDARILRAARARRDHEMRRRERLRVRHGQRIVAVDVHVRAEHEERLHEVVRERVVVVDQKQLDAHNPSSASSSALRRIALFASTSRYSLSGTLSATMPAPAWKLYSSPSNTIVRIVIAWSMLPFVPK